MHHALYLEEILFNIFRPPESVAQRHHYTADLAVLARTCQTFKEPALNLLWVELVDLSPLARCLPEACRSSGKNYSFSRKLNEAEWKTLRSYTRRVQFIHGFSTHLGSLDDNSIRAVFNPPSSAPLFPNLRSLYWRDITSFPVVHVAVPLLTSLTLHVHFYPGGGCLSRHFLDSAADLCPNIKQFRIYMSRPHPLDETISRHVCRWTSLQVMGSHNVALNVDAITHLSSMSTLTRLSFTLSPKLADHITDLDSVFVFSHLAHLEIHSEFLASITGLLPHIQLPVVKGLVVKVWSSPSKQAVETYLTTIRNACPSDALTHLKLLDTGDQMRNPIHLDPQAQHHLTLDVLLPCMYFVNLCGIHVNLKWCVNLTDVDLLALASASPRLEHLIINDMWGWRTEGGITLDGLLQLLRACPSLYDMCFAIDTPTYTQIPEGLDVSFPARPRLWMNVVDSDIHAADVPALVSVFTEAKLEPAVFMAWSGTDMKHLAGARAARSLWETVYKQVKVAFTEESVAPETLDRSW
ncbi:hypothetical protein OG21DRAFT_1501012 [Imleria badia]|nr:hypothetical protein OG21DRAFT_1501012 [Imleria badia]